MILWANVSIYTLLWQCCIWDIWLKFQSAPKSFFLEQGDSCCINIPVSIIFFYLTLLWMSPFFRGLSRFEDQTETSDKFSLRWDDRSEGGGWMKESRKPEPDFFMTSAITSVDERWDIVSLKLYVQPVNHQIINVFMRDHRFQAHIQKKTRTSRRYGRSSDEVWRRESHLIWHVLWKTR